MRRLSRPLSHLKPRYDVVVVGSGYGGAIAAARLAGSGRRVCVLERGREIHPGDYPDTFLKLAREFQVDLPTRHLRARTALFDLRVNEDINVLVGCGLGGTSLINANVALWPHREVFEDERWPASIRTRDDHADRLLLDGREAAEDVLAPRKVLQQSRFTSKYLRLRDASLAFSERGPDKFEDLPITVNFQDGPQPACVHCGDCVTGCNVGAKNTVLMNYLPAAERGGAEIFTEMLVRRIRPDGDGWAVDVEPLGTGGARFGAPPLRVHAPLLVLTAGTLGTTEILLRSRDAALPLSDALGTRFSGNGDAIAFSYNADGFVDGLGAGARPRREGHDIGPTATAAIDLRKERNLVIMEGVIPGALSSAFALLLAGTSLARTTAREGGPRPWEDGAAARLCRMLWRGGRPAAERTLTFLAMSKDDGNGRLEISPAGRLQVRWPGVADQPNFHAVRSALREATARTGGVFLDRVIPLTTVHPLGGCCMADRAEDGVVDHRGRVFRGRTGTAVHPGLYVCDGSVIPRPLATNPFLTIAAVAERTCRLILRPCDASA